MDPRIVKQILDLKVHHQYPEGSTKKEKYVMKRRADTFRIKETNQLFEEFHCSNIGGHCGVEKTHCAIIARYYWPGMENDIRKWIAHCPQCQAKTANIKEKLEYSPIEVKINNGILVLSLNKMVAGHPKRWDQVLQSTMFGLRTKKQLTTKYSPYYLMFGREARYHSEVPKEYVVKEEKVSRLVEREEIYEGLKKQEAVFTEVKQNMKRSQDNVRKRKVKKGQEDNFQVLRRNVRQEQRKGGKLEDDWLEPYIILELEGKKAIVGKGTKKLQTNIDHLTHYFQPEERIPAKLQKLSDPSPLAGPQHTKTQTHIHSTQTPHKHPPHKHHKWHLHPWTATPKWHQRILNFVIIRQIWTGRRKQMLWCKFGPYKVYSENLMDFAPGKWLEGEIVNSYLTMVGRKAGALMIDSYLMTSLWEGNHKGSLRSLDLFKHDVAVGAVCHHGHWTLIMTYPSSVGLVGSSARWLKIECTTCNMWYHIGCVGLPPPQRMSIFALHASRDGRTLPAPARSIPASGAADPTS
ncbi:hypothetical protein F7725_016525 [Dissostichus mawsoni]|uniref:Gypsy retrotransposon integrase-like protein 1 n=1 Tax=Dissostichus mawsoni TaxID=36200 RepID=A0A7J5Z1V3_DISMA|nr:hypothetical protein F7725_016525 [Dissostichus mawsoni]